MLLNFRSMRLAYIKSKVYQIGISEVNEVNQLKIEALEIEIEVLKNAIKEIHSASKDGVVNDKWIGWKGIKQIVEL